MAKFATTIQAGDGAKTAFPVSFDFITREDVDVYLLANSDTDSDPGAKLAVVETGIPGPGEFKWDSDTQITLGTVPDEDQRVKIQRTTDISQQAVNWRDGSYIISDDLNTSEQQNLYVDQELYDYITDLQKRLNDLFPGLSEETITETMVDAGFDYGDWDDKRLATAGATKRLVPFYGATEPPQILYPGKLWFEPGPTEYLRIWTGSKWKTITTNNGSITPFEPAEIIYVNTQGNDANNGRSKETAVRSIEKALEIANAKTDNPAVGITNATYDKSTGQVTITCASPHNLIRGNSVLISSLRWTCEGSGEKAYPVSPTTYPVLQTQGTNSFVIYVGPSTIDHTFVPLSGGTADPVDTVFGDGKIISVAAGVYAENMPLQVFAKNLSIIGDSLRNTYIHPAVPNDNSYDPNGTAVDNEVGFMFECDSGSYLYGFTFAGIKARGPIGDYPLDPGPYGLPAEQGWAATFREGAVITKSPYIQNCTALADSSIDNRVKGNYSNGTGFDPDYLAGEGGDITSNPTGGGILCDGQRVGPGSPLRSFVVDSFTQIALNGPGILACNLAYAQLVSFFGTFCRYHAKARSGATLNLSNCTTDFGKYGLIADGKSPQIFTGRVEKTVEAGTTGDQQEVVSILDAVYSEGSLVIKPDAFKTAVVSVGTLVRIQQLRFEKDGSQPKFIPTSFSKEYSVQGIDQVAGTFEITIGNTEIDPADGWAYVADSGSVLVPTGGTNGPQPSTVITVNNFGDASAQWAPPRALVPGSTMLMEANGILYPIVAATPTDASKTEFNIEVYSPLNAFNKTNRGFVNKVEAGETVRFYLQSYISTGGHTMEFVGSGTDYRAHPDYGGVPVTTNEAVELGGEEAQDAPLLAPFNGGRVWLSSTDQNGTFRVGKSFKVNQQTGQIFIDPSFITQPPLRIEDNIDVGPWSIYTEYGTDTNVNIAPKGSGGLIIGGEVTTDGSGPQGPSTAPIIGPVKERSINSEGEQRDFPVVTQQDIGYDADEVPVGGLLGELAFTNTPPSVGVAVTDPQPNEVKFYLTGTTLTIKAANPVGTVYSGTITLTEED